MAREEEDGGGGGGGGGTKEDAEGDRAASSSPSPPLLLLESGGDNLAANFSSELADYTIYVIDVAGGDKVPRKGGPGITQSDLLVVGDPCAPLFRRERLRDDCRSSASFACRGSRALFRHGSLRRAALVSSREHRRPRQINKIDLAEAVGADLTVMDRDARKMRRGRSGGPSGPTVFASVKNGVGTDDIIERILYGFRSANELVESAQ